MIILIWILFNACNASLNLISIFMDSSLIFLHYAQVPNEPQQCRSAIFQQRKHPVCYEPSQLHISIRPFSDGSIPPTSEIVTSVTYLKNLFG